MARKNCICLIFVYVKNRGGKYMPYKLGKKKGKYCMTNTETGKTYCYDSEKKRKEGMRMHEAFAHGFKPTGKKKK